MHGAGAGTVANVSRSWASLANNAITNIIATIATPSPYLTLPHLPTTAPSPPLQLLLHLGNHLDIP